MRLVLVIEILFKPKHAPVMYQNDMVAEMGELVWVYNVVLGLAMYAGG